MCKNRPWDFRVFVHSTLQPYLSLNTVLNFPIRLRKGPTSPRGRSETERLEVSLCRPRLPWLALLMVSCRALASRMSSYGKGGSQETRVFTEGFILMEMTKARGRWGPAATASCSASLQVCSR